MSKPNKRLSAAERAVLQRQKALASQMSSSGGIAGTTNKVGGAPASASTLSAEQRSRQQQRAVQMALSRRAAAAGTGTGVSLSSSSSTINKFQSSSNNAKNTTTTSSSTTQQQQHRRPGSKGTNVRPPPPPPPKKPTMTPEEAVAAARAKVGIPTSSSTDSGNNDKGNEQQQQQTRKASILSNLTATKVAESGGNVSSRFYRTPEMEDYWRNMRNWNFLKDVEDANDPQQQQQQSSNDTGGGKGNKNSSPKNKTLPDVFESYEHYASAWAGPCLAEARAQMLSDVLSELPYMKSNGSTNLFQKVHVQPLTKDIGSGKDYLTVQLKRFVDPDNPQGMGGSGGGGRSGGGRGNKGKGGGGGGGSSDEGFRPGDIVFLATSEYELRQALFGNNSNNNNSSKKQRRNNNESNPNDTSLLHNNNKSTDSNRRRGMIGTCEVNGYKATVDGLALKVSRRIWTNELNGKPDEIMWLMRLNSSVTSLREFGALCDVKQIPLLQSLLTCKDEHGKPKQETSSSSGSTTTGATTCNTSTSTTTDSTDAAAAAIDADEEPPPPPQKTKAMLLEEMGGKDALGSGFAKFAYTKFNESQLEAISMAARDYGSGGFTLVKGPPGTGKTTTLTALVNALHIKQFNKYYEELRRIATVVGTQQANGERQRTTSVGLVSSFRDANRNKPRILVCAPSNAAVDNIILKIMEDGFVDGNGQRYNPSIVRVGSGQSSAVADVSLTNCVDAVMNEAADVQRLHDMISAQRVQLQQLHKQICQLQRRARAILDACPWELSQTYEIRIDESTFEETGRAFFVNHKEQTTSFDIPPPPEPGEKSYPARSMPEYRAFVTQLMKLIEKFNVVASNVERYSLLNSTSSDGGSSRGGGANSSNTTMIRQQIETHILDSVHVVLTTLGTAGSKTMESAAKFEVVVIDEAAQSVEPATLPSLQLGSSHAILVGDPQQLPATIFSVSGKTTKYDRSLFQRLEEAGHPVHMLNTQYRMHPEISNFPRRIFYEGALQDGPNVQQPNYGTPLLPLVQSKVPTVRPFTIFDLESSEERSGGKSLSNPTEANFALYLYRSLNELTNGMIFQTKVAIISPYSQQVALLRRTFQETYGSGFESRIEINTVDGFQGRESNLVIFSAVRAAGSRGIGFLSDVRRMNVALTRAKYLFFVIARCSSIVVNPYWKDLVQHAKDMQSVLTVRSTRGGGGRRDNHHHRNRQQQGEQFPNLTELKPSTTSQTTTTGGGDGGRKRIFVEN